MEMALILSPGGMSQTSCADPETTWERIAWGGDEIGVATVVTVPPFEVAGAHVAAAGRPDSKSKHW